MSADNAIPHIDPVEIVESSLNRMFVTVFNNEAARQYFGFARISPFHSHAGLPGWYLWFEEKAGAYGVSITDAAVQYRAADRPIGSSPMAARIAVAYFPDPDETVFDTFSWFEKIARVNDGFDDSGTPTLETRERLPQRYFTVGHIDLLMTGAGDLLSLACTAADEWVDIWPAGLELINPEGRPFQAVRAGARDRSVPGWSLTHILLDRLVSALLHCQQLRVKQVSGYGFAMPEYLIRADGPVEKTSDQPIKGYSLLLIPEFSQAPGDPDDDPAQKLRCWQDALDDTAYPKTRLWKKAWSSSRPEDSQWGSADWWEVENLHFHDHGEHLCACYADR